MFQWISVLTMLAEDAPEEVKQPAGNPLGGMLIPMVMIGVLWYFLLLRPQLNERRQRQNLVESLKKNDKVISIGGIIGTVTNLSADGKEVTLRIDDNAKIRMLRSSIQTVITDEGKPATDS
ncbi:MAG TPA: preprotein translocase subunit YajC [Planctomycetaceae bacterium]|nr:preprotein translocase subunit YajC [Planctomycetaceae bacterium]